MRRACVAAAAALLVAAPLALIAHKFHQSMCEINHNAAAKTYEIILQIHIDDLEAWLALQQGRQLDLGGMKNARPLIEPYVRGVFALTDGAGRGIALKWIGADTGRHFIEVYLEAPAEPAPVELRNEIMTAFLPDQRNWVRLRENDRGAGRSATLSATHTTYVSKKNSACEYEIALPRTRPEVAKSSRAIQTPRCCSSSSIG